MSSPSPPPLDVRFGSSLHTEYGGAATAAGPTILPSSAVVVSPSLLGSERNVTNFHEIRDELERIAREDKNDSGWSFERNVGRDGVIKLPSRALMNRAGSVNDAVQRICQYFSIQHDTVGVGVLCRRGRPRIQYCSDQGYVRTCTNWFVFFQLSESEEPADLPPVCARSHCAFSPVFVFTPLLATKVGTLR